MSKSNSKVELLATNKKRSTCISDQKNFVSKIIINSPMKFPSVTDGFTIPFSLKPISDKIKYQGIVTIFYNFLTIEDLFNMKINQQHYPEVNQSSFIAICSLYLKKVASRNGLMLCGTEGHLYKICSRR